jgi:hypothetical protein
MCKALGSIPQLKKMVRKISGVNVTSAISWWKKVVKPRPDPSFFK